MITKFTQIKFYLGHFGGFAIVVQRLEKGFIIILNLIFNKSINYRFKDLKIVNNIFSLTTCYTRIYKNIKIDFFFLLFNERTLSLKSIA